MCHIILLIDSLKNSVIPMVQAACVSHVFVYDVINVNKIIIISTTKRDYRANTIILSDVLIF